MKRLIFTTVSILGAFGAGLYAGSYITQKKMQDQMDEEIAAMEEYWQEKIDILECESVDTEDTVTLEEVESVIGNLNYSNITPESEKITSTPSIDDICEIEILSDPDEYGEDLTYDMVDNLTYYADGYLVDDYDEVVENYSDLVGEEAFSAFEDGVVYVKNNVNKTYYQILKSDEKYSNIVWETKIHLND